MEEPNSTARFKRVLKGVRLRLLLWTGKRDQNGKVTHPGSIEGRLSQGPRSRGGTGNPHKKKKKKKTPHPPQHQTTPKTKTPPPPTHPPPPPPPPPQHTKKKKMKKGWGGKICWDSGENERSHYIIKGGRRVLGP